MNTPLTDRAEQKQITNYEHLREVDWPPFMADFGFARELEKELHLTSRLQPIETAPRDGTYIILLGPSGYITTPLRAEVCRYDAEYRPLQPWVNHANDSFLDGGEAPTYWLPLPWLVGSTWGELKEPV